jgi:hypothetical protein
MIAANNGHLLAFDTVSGCPLALRCTLPACERWQFRGRQLYTDDEEVLFKSACQTLLNGDRGCHWPIGFG